MGRGLLTFLLALVIAGAPVATAVCQARCAAHDMDSSMAMSGVEHHSCHGESSPAGLVVNGLPHGCGHSDEFPASIEQALHVVGAPAIAVDVISFIPPTGDVARVGSAPIEQGQPG